MNYTIKRKQMKVEYDYYKEMHKRLNSFENLQNNDKNIQTSFHFIDNEADKHVNQIDKPDYNHCEIILDDLDACPCSYIEKSDKYIEIYDEDINKSEEETEQEIKNEELEEKEYVDKSYKYDEIYAEDITSSEEEPEQEIKMKN